jgi:hypothetical protein
MHNQERMSLGQEGRLAAALFRLLRGFVGANQAPKARNAKAWGNAPGKGIPTETGSAEGAG